MNKSLDTQTAVILLGGEENSLSVCRSLGRRGIKIHLIVAVDCSARYSRYAKSIAVINNRFQWHEKLQEILLGTPHGYPEGSIIFPCDDASIAFVAEQEQALREHYLLEPASAAQRQQMLSKWATLQLAERVGCGGSGFLVARLRATRRRNG